MNPFPSPPASTEEPAAPQAQRVLKKCHAKVNLWLQVIRRREDGFHEISSRMTALELHDDLAVFLSPDGRDFLACDRDDIPVGPENLIWKAAAAFRERTGIRSPLHVKLTKRIPHGAGLGGGSSDAAAMLRAMNDLNAEPLTPEELHAVAAGIGSDVPFFLNSRVCDVSGRGEILTDVSDWRWQLPLLLVKPAFAVATPLAYRGWADSTWPPGAMGTPQLTPWGTMFNDLERPVFQKFPLLAEMKSWLLRDGGVRAALMSGSGATILAIPNNDHDGARLAAEAKERFGPTTWIQLTRTLAHE